MAEKTVRVCDLCLQEPGGIAISSGAVAWRGYKGTIDVCRSHQIALEKATGAPPSLPPASKASGKQKQAETGEGEVSTTPKRGPGRPRKDQSAAPSPTPKKRGRPRKDASEAAPGVKRGPGRPRKSDTASATPAKRGPGRPRKTESAATGRKPKPTRKVTARKKTVLTPAPATIRAWAISNKIPVSARGAIGASTLAAYYDAHPNITEKKAPAPATRSTATKLKGRASKKPSGATQDDATDKSLPEFSSATP